MLIYLAGQEGEEFRQLTKSVGNKNFLMSYYYLKGATLSSMFNSWDFKPNVFVDSGGFTARTKGAEVNIQDYIAFIKENKDWITAYANLDMTKTEDTLANQKIMEEAGLTPLPVYHADERLELLREYLKDHKYIAVGGLAGQKMEKEDMYKFLRKVNGIVTEAGGKIHAFGVTVPQILKDLNIHSCDSTSWLMGGKYGNLYYLRKGELLGCHHKEKLLHKYKGEMDKVGINYDSIKEGDYRALNKWNAYVWVCFNEAMDIRHGITQPVNATIATTNNLEQPVDNSAGEIKENTNTLLGIGEDTNIGVEQQDSILEDSPIDLTPNDINRESESKDITIVEGETSKERPPYFGARTSTGGKPIQEILKDPALKKKKEERYQEVMKHNTYNYKHGRYSIRKPPAICSMDCYVADKCKVREFGKLCCVDERMAAITKAIGTDDPESVIQYLNSLNRIDMQRHQKNLFFETVEGGELDKNVTQLGMIITDRWKIALQIKNELENLGKTTANIDARGGEVKIYNFSPEITKAFIEAKMKEGTFKNIEGGELTDVRAFDRGTEKGRTGDIRER